MTKWINDRLDEGMGYREMFHLFRQTVVCEALLRCGWRSRNTKTKGSLARTSRLLKVHRNSIDNWTRPENGQEKSMWPFDRKAKKVASKVSTPISTSSVPRHDYYPGNYRSSRPVHDDSGDFVTGAVVGGAIGGVEGALLGGMIGGVVGGVIGGEIAASKETPAQTDSFSGFDGGSSGGAGASGDFQSATSCDPTPDTSSSYDSGSTPDCSSSPDSGSSYDSGSSSSDSSF